ncbi:MAG: lytic transglycosylase domain-containing protein [Saprospiraceae bacterium]|nr:lytic transglycosylase domain-containing protein [Saprospiraceae bacterium]
MFKQNQFLGGIFLGALLVLGSLLGLSYTSPKVMPPIYELPQLVRPPKLGSSFSFAGENIPMNVDTRERLERELLLNAYHHTSTVLALKNANRYFPMIERILREEGIPEDFKFLAVAESNLTNATSSSGAKGLWQFMKGTAGDYGLEVNTEVEERFHYEKSTRAAAKFIKMLKNKTGSWINAAAAYNMGLAALNKSLEAQDERSFFDVNLNEETSRYIFRIVALKEIMCNPEGFGYYVDEDQKYGPHKGLNEVEVVAPIENLSELAHKYGISYRLLKYYNPWLIDTKLTGKDKKYVLLIPETK